MSSSNQKQSSFKLGKVKSEPFDEPQTERYPKHQKLLVPKLEPDTNSDYNFDIKKEWQEGWGCSYTSHSASSLSPDYELNPSFNHPVAGTLNGNLSVPNPESDALSATSFVEGETLIEAAMSEGDREISSDESKRAFEEPPRTPPAPLIASIDAGAYLKADSLEGTDVSTPAPGTEKTESSSESRPRRKRGSGMELAIVQESPETPDWLPDGWRIEHRIRGSGASAGTMDRYFYDPVSRRQFRSKKEVLTFLETGVKAKHRAKSNSKSPDPHTMPSGRVERRPLVFDFSNRPATVKWVYNGPSEGSWTPFIGDRVLPESTRKEWEAAFDHVVSRSSRDGMFTG